MNPEDQLGQETLVEDLDASQEGEGSQSELPTHTEDGQEIFYDDPDLPNGYIKVEEEEPAPTPAPVVRPTPAVQPAPVVQNTSVQQQVNAAPNAYSAEAYLKENEVFLKELSYEDPTRHAALVGAAQLQDQAASTAITDHQMEVIQEQFPELMEGNRTRMKAALQNLPQPMRRDPSAVMYAVQWTEGNRILDATKTGISQREAKIKELKRSLELLEGKQATAPAPKPAVRQPNPNAPRVPSGGGVAAPSRSSGGGTPRGTGDASIRAYMETYGMSYDEAKALRSNWSNQH